MTKLEPTFDPESGLIAAVCQHHATGEVLMLAWMNRDAWQRTLATGHAHFWSRSRKALWMKGETSGNVLHVREVRVDCDADAVLVRVDPHGPACHTGKPSCFYRSNDGSEDDGPPGDAIAALGREIRARAALPAGDPAAAKSYTRQLLDKGMAKILAKIAEEHGELAAELANPAAAPERVVSETADLLYHVLVGLAARAVAPEDVLVELARRFGTSGLAEKAARPPKE